MKYENICEGYFLDRPNRFIAHVEIDGQVETVHVKNTGRCAELLKPGAVVYLQDAKNPERKTRYDLIGVKKGTRQVNMDSQVTNTVVKEWIEAGNFASDVTLVKSEYTYGKSRFDLYVEAGKRKIFIEVKGVTLEEDGVALFPDAPTERGVKHVRGLTTLAAQGCRCVVLIVIQMKGVDVFKPNWTTHPAFGEAMLEAQADGVEIIAMDCEVRPGEVRIDGSVRVELEDDR